MLKNPILQKKMEEELRPYEEIQEDRWNRYFDCQDDSIAGGLSMQVTDNTMSQIRRKYQMLDDQDQNGGYLFAEIRQACLFDTDGNFLTDKIVPTRFGNCFVYTTDNTNFVALSKKSETLLKKGYICKIRVRKYKYKFTGIYTRNNNPKFKSIELVSEGFENWDGEYSNSSSWIEYCFINNILLQTN